MAWALPAQRSEQDQIDSLYLEPLDNWWGSIPDGFRALKSRARTVADRLEEPLYLLQQILEATDPARALAVAEDLWGEFRHSGILVDGIYDQDFHRVVLDHREQYETLRNSGLLDRFLAIRLACCHRPGVAGHPYLATELPLSRQSDVCHTRCRQDTGQPPTPLDYPAPRPRPTPAAPSAGSNCPGPLAQSVGMKPR